jgi:hypothetical protein
VEGSNRGLDAFQKPALLRKFRPWPKGEVNISLDTRLDDQLSSEMPKRILSSRSYGSVDAQNLKEELF